MGDRRTNDRRVSDRRVSDRREIQKGTMIIKTKQAIIILAVVLFILVDIILGILYFNYKRLYEDAFDSINELYLSPEENEDSYFTKELEEDYTCDLQVKGDKNEIKAGETITFEISANNIRAGKGISMFEALLDYDTESFKCEIISDEESDWEEIEYADNFLTMSRKDLMSSSENQGIVKIALTANEDIEEGEKELGIEEIVFISEDDKIFLVPDQQITINIVSVEK